MGHPFFYHHRIGRAAITFAIDISIPADDGNRWVQYSYALCSPRCQFSRKKGRTISGGRLNHVKHKHVSGFTIDEGEIKKVHNLVWSSFFSDVGSGEAWIHRVGWLKKLEKLMVKADKIQKGIWYGKECSVEDVYRRIRKLTNGTRGTNGTNRGTTERENSSVNGSLSDGNKKELASLHI